MLSDLTISDTKIISFFVTATYIIHYFPYSATVSLGVNIYVQETKHFPFLFTMYIISNIFRPSQAHLESSVVKGQLSPGPN